MQRDVARTVRLVLLALAAVALLVPATAVARKQTRSHHGMDHRGGHQIVGACTPPRTTWQATPWSPTRGAPMARSQELRRLTPAAQGSRHSRRSAFRSSTRSGSTNLTPDGRLLFVANDGDNSISSFRITPFGPRLVENVTSGGILPVSITTRGNLLYVVNEESGSIFGYRFSGSGHLQPSPASSERSRRLAPMPRPRTSASRPTAGS
jgi:hypothetical protein